MTGKTDPARPMAKNHMPLSILRSIDPKDAELHGDIRNAYYALREYSDVMGQIVQAVGKMVHPAERKAGKELRDYLSRQCAEALAVIDQSQAVLEEVQAMLRRMT